MAFLRKHWYDLGGFLSVAVSLFLIFRGDALTNFQRLMWINLLTLFFHQLEEYRLPGTFPGMLNAVMYKSKLPDRYPLNTNTAFYVNVGIGWTVYFLAAVFAEKAVWLCIATTAVSLSNTVAHTMLFNTKGKTFYNAGLVTSWLLFVPCACFFFSIIHKEHLVTKVDYLIGIPLGIFLNVIGIVKLIDWMADADTFYTFDQRNLLPKDRSDNTG